MPSFLRPLLFTLALIASLPTPARPAEPADSVGLAVTINEGVAVRDIAFHPDGSVFAVANEGDAVSIYDAVTLRSTGRRGHGTPSPYEARVGAVTARRHPTKHGSARSRHAVTLRSTRCAVTHTKGEYLRRLQRDDAE